MLKCLSALGVVGLVSTAGIAIAADTIEAVGAERCGGAVQRLEVAFLAPETAPLEARVKILLQGADQRTQTTSLSMDGKPCENARCPFEATKGTTYRFVVETGATGFDDLCVSVARP